MKTTNQVIEAVKDRDSVSELELYREAKRQQRAVFVLVAVGQTVTRFIEEPA